MKILKFIGAIGIISLLMTLAEKLGEIITMSNIMMGLNIVVVISVIGLIITERKERRRKNG